MVSGPCELPARVLARRLRRQQLTATKTLGAEALVRPTAPTSAIGFMSVEVSRLIGTKN